MGLDYLGVSGRSQEVSDTIQSVQSAIDYGVSHRQLISIDTVQCGEPELSSALARR